MGSVETYAKIKEAQASKLEKAKAVVSEIEAEIALVDQLIAEKDAEKVVEVDAAYNEGLAKAGVANGPDKVFTNEEFEAEVAAKTAPLNEKISQLEAQLAAVPPVVDVQSEVAKALKAQKAEFRAVVHAQQAAENEGESAMLKFFEDDEPSVDPIY